MLSGVVNQGLQFEFDRTSWLSGLTIVRPLNCEGTSALMITTFRNIEKLSLFLTNWKKRLNIITQRKRLHNSYHNSVV